MITLRAWMEIVELIDDRRDELKQKISDFRYDRGSSDDFKNIPLAGTALGRKEEQKVQINGLETIVETHTPKREKSREEVRLEMLTEARNEIIAKIDKMGLEVSAMLDKQ